MYLWRGPATREKGQRPGADFAAVQRSSTEFAQSLNRHQVLTPKARILPGLPNVEYVASLPGQHSQAARGAHYLATAFAVRSIDLNHGFSRFLSNQATLEQLPRGLLQ